MNKNLLLKYFYENRLDLIGIVEGKHAFVGPQLVQIDLTDECNLACVGCWCNSPSLKNKNRVKDTLPYLKIVEIIDELMFDLGTKEIYLGGGGEPFMHPCCMDIIEHIKRRGLICHINTNFTLVDKEKAKRLVNLNVDHITVSLWAGDPETYVKTHPNQSKEVFNRIKFILKFIKILKQKYKKEKPLIKLYNVISNLNYDKIESMVKFAYKYGDSVEFTVIDPIEGYTDKLLLNEKQINSLLEICKKIRKKYNKITLFRFNQFLRRVNAKNSIKGYYDKEVIDKFPCLVGWIFARILANGNVIPCLKAHKKPIGNILKQNFKDIFFSEPYNTFRHKAKTCKKNDPYFNEIRCYKTCDDFGRNKEKFLELISLKPEELEVLELAKKLRVVKGMIDCLKKWNIDIGIYKKRFEFILNNIPNMELTHIEENINLLYKELNEKIIDENQTFLR